MVFVTLMELIGRSAVIRVAPTGLLVVESATVMELRGKNTNEVNTMKRNYTHVVHNIYCISLN
jgi:hypothetical protein